ncbi:MAG: aminotransferase class IV [Candidatus Zixiibacteriota bacterium]|nr:MAG: aminotransferase class IV [candidate division Zixibacteria bacterium]
MAKAAEINKPLKTITSVNGRIVRRGQDKISVFDNSLLYAEGLFETFLAKDDHAIFAEEHLRRLYRGAKVINLDIPAKKEALRKWMKSALRAHPDEVKKLRLTVTSGESARWVGLPGKPQVVLIVSPHELPEEPFKLHVSEFRVDQKSVFRIIKTLSYAIHAAALKQAKAVGCDDALLLNESHQVAEVTSANIYWVKKGHVFTPPIGSGCLEGVTRKIVLRESKRLGFDVTEKNGTLNTLLNADEVFISSSLKLVVGVGSIKIRRETHRISTGPVTEAFSHHFRRMTGFE